MQGFTEKEANEFLHIKRRKEDFHDIKPYTGTNPLLLSEVLNHSEDHSYQSTIQNIVQRFLEYNLQLKTDNKVKAIAMLNSLAKCKKCS